MTKLLLILLLAAPAILAGPITQVLPMLSACTLAATATSLATATWTGTGCDTGGYVPTTGDTVDIPNLRTLTLQSGETLSFGTAPGSTVLTLNATGGIITNTGATLRVAGDVTIAPGNAAFFTQQPGSSIWVNGTVKPTTNSTHQRVWNADCSSGAKCNTGWDAAGGFARWHHNGMVASPSHNWKNVDAWRWGNATNGNTYYIWNSAPSTSMSWTDVKCEFCAAWASQGTQTAGSTTHLRVEFRNSVGTGAWVPSYVSSFTNSVYDRQFNANENGGGGVAPLPSTVTISNVFLNRTFPAFSGAGSSANVSDVLVRRTGFVDNSSGPFNILNPVRYTYWPDNNIGNTEGLTIPSTLSGAMTLNQFLYEFEGKNTEDRGSGLIHTGTGTLTVRNSVFLGGPYSDGYNAFTPFQPNANNGGNLTVENNYFDQEWGFGYGHSIQSALSTPSRLTAYRYNIMEANPGGGNWWAHDVDQQNLNSSCAGYTQTDANMAQIGRNVSRYAVAAAQPGTCNTNSANAYGGKWSTTPPGVSDQIFNPRTADNTRRLTTFPTAYLKMTGTAGNWATSTAYTADQTVLSSDASNVGGAQILYRAIKNHTSNAINKPGKAGLSVANGGLVSISVANTPVANTATIVFAANHGLTTGDVISAQFSMTAAGAYTVTVTNATTVTFTVPTTVGVTSYSSASYQVDLWRTFWEYGIVEMIRSETLKVGTSQEVKCYGADLDVGDGSCRTEATACNIIRAAQQWVINGRVATNPDAWNISGAGDNAGPLTPARYKVTVGLLAGQ